MLHHKGTVTLSTPRLVLRRITAADASDAFRNYATDPEVARFLSWEPYTDAAPLECFFMACADQYEDNTFYHWAIEYCGEMVGSISTVALDARNQLCELGYCIGRAFWGQGITTEAMNAVMAYLFRTVGLRRIVAKYDADNPASGRVMQKCGMIYEGRLRGHYLRHDGTVGDSLVYGILREEFAQ